MKRLILITFVLILVNVPARAVLFSFYGITSNDPSGNAVTIGETQLSMDVNILSPGLVSVLFENTGLYSSSVAEIYFDSPTVIPPLNLELFSIINGSGVKYVEDEAPDTLPGGNDPLIQFSADVAAEAGNPAPKNGINPGEWLELHLTYTDPPHNFIDMLMSGELRVGLHVIGLGDDGFGGNYSESFINEIMIPEPSTALLLGVAALFCRTYRKILFI